MPKQTWIIATILSALVVVGFVSLSAWRKSVAGDRLREELRVAREEMAAAARRAQQTAEELAATREQVAALQREKESVVQQQSALEQQMRSAIESKDVTISELQGRLTVNILDRVLFDSGEADLRPEGQQVLLKVAGVLAPHGQRQIHVVGHTDNVPIRRKFSSNWELSCARATAAVRFLVEQAKVDPRRLGAVGHGEFHPIADNATAEGRARNRRIEIVVLPEEFKPVTPLAPAPDAPLPLIPTATGTQNLFDPPRTP
jgi:chemotaxis protein MotB